MNSGDRGPAARPRSECFCGAKQPCENMVGVNMVLAEFVRFKHGLYRSCGIEWFEGIVLEPCLLQPCFHVAGQSSTPQTTSLLHLFQYKSRSNHNYKIINTQINTYISIYIYIYICMYVCMYVCMCVYIYIYI